MCIEYCHEAYVLVVDMCQQVDSVVDVTVCCDDDASVDVVC